MKRPVASVIIPCRNHARELDRCLKSLTGPSVEVLYEILVVDSDIDERVLSVVERYPGVRLVRSERGLLPGAARNVGAQEALGVYLIFIDADCIAETSWADEAVLALEQGAKLVGGPVLHGWAGYRISVADNLLQFSSLGPNQVQSGTQTFPGCNMAIRKSDFEAVSGFPAMHLALPSGEDVLFCLRVAQRWPDRLKFVPGVRVKHFGRTTIGQLWTHHNQFGFVRGAYALLLKPWQRKAGRSLILVPVIMLKRVSYIVRSSLKTRQASPAELMVLLPILLVGLLSWSLGFRRGCRYKLDLEEAATKGVARVKPKET